MLILTKAILAMMLSFIASVVIGYVLIPYFKKNNASQRLSIYLNESHKSKRGTPTMGGLIFIIPTLIVTAIFVIFKKIDISYSLIIVIFTLISYALIGFIDDYLIIKKNNNKGLSEGMKLIMQVVTAIIFFYLFMISGNEPILWIHLFNLKINIGWFYGIFILFILVASSNAVNLTDGLDGLAGGLSVAALLSFGVISFNTGWLDGYEGIAIFIFILIGSILGFLVYNVSPSKIFMGDTGSLALGATLGSIAIITRHELLLALIGIVFVLETLSCIIQRVYYKFTKKRIFPMTPIHHTFEKLGWSERDIVKLFWIFGLIASLLGILYGVWF